MTKCVGGFYGIGNIMRFLSQFFYSAGQAYNIRFKYNQFRHCSGNRDFEIGRQCWKIYFLSNKTGLFKSDK